MIIDKIFDIVKSILDTVIGAIPSGSTPDVELAFTTARDALGHPFGVIAWLIPWHELGQCVVLLAAWWVVCEVYRLTLWFLGKIHVTGAGE